MSRAHGCTGAATYRIAVGPPQGRKVFTLQTLPACDESFDDGVGKVAEFSLEGILQKSMRLQAIGRGILYHPLESRIGADVERGVISSRSCHTEPVAPTD